MLNHNRLAPTRPTPLEHSRLTQADQPRSLASLDHPHLEPVSDLDVPLGRACEGVGDQRQHAFEREVWPDALLEWREGRVTNLVLGVHLRAVASGGSRAGVSCVSS